MFQGDWGIPQQAIFENGSGTEHRKNSKPIVVYTACQFVKMNLKIIGCVRIIQSCVRKNITYNKGTVIEIIRLLC